jgi:hypothetical protein
MSNFSYYERALRSFSLLTVFGFAIFWLKEMGRKAAHKMLVIN